MTRFYWMTAGLVLALWPAGAVWGQNLALSSLALASALGQENQSVANQPPCRDCSEPSCCSIGECWRLFWLAWHHGQDTACCNQSCAQTTTAATGTRRRCCEECTDCPCKASTGSCRDQGTARKCCCQESCAQNGRGLEAATQWTPPMVVGMHGISFPPMPPVVMLPPGWDRVQVYHPMPWPAHMGFPGTMPGAPPPPPLPVTLPRPGHPLPGTRPLCPVLHYEVNMPVSQAAPAPHGPGKALHITTTDHGVQIRGHDFEAQCQRLTYNQQQCLVLEGNVRIQIRRDHQPASIEAAHVVVNLKEGTFAVGTASRNAQMPRTGQIQTAPVSRSVFRATTGPQAPGTDYSVNPNLRMEELLNNSQDLRNIQDEWRQFWNYFRLHHTTPIRVHGGIGP